MPTPPLAVQALPSPRLGFGNLDESSERLALTSKRGAILVQRFDDPVTLNAVNEVEALTSGMSRKIVSRAREPRGMAPSAGEARAPLGAATRNPRRSRRATERR